MLVPSVRGLEPFKSYIDGIARNARGTTTEVVTDYLLGNEARGFRHYPVQMGQKYRRTFAARAGWARRGSGVLSRAENSVSYSPYLWQEGSQAWWARKYNWRSTKDITSTNIAGATRAAEQALVKKNK